MDVEMLDRVAGRKVSRPNAEALLVGLAMFPAGLDKPHRLAQFLAQVLHESGGLRYVKEIWGPTDAQKGYEGATRLGNTEPGDGSKFRGYGLIQNTGRANATAFRGWCWKRELPAPDFAEFPEKQAEAPWAGLVAVWYWDSRGLNYYADQGDIEMVTRKVNGGLNGYDDRCAWYTSTALVMLGFARDDVDGFQGINGLRMDGIAGPKTRAALHQRLVELPAGVDRVAALEARVAALEAAVATLRMPAAAR